METFNSTPTNSTRSAVGYVRVSTEKQAECGVSLEAQDAKIRAMAALQDAQLVDVIVDAESAKDLNRPGMARLLALVESRAVQTVIVAKLDRLTRSVRDLGELLERFQRRGVSLVSVAESLDTKTAAGRLVLNVMASVSQWEREAIGERTRDAMRHMQTAGQYTGGSVPFGYQLSSDGEHLNPNAAEQTIVSRVGELREGGCSLRAVADELNAQGYMTRRGTAWRHQYVAALAARPACEGTRI